MSDRLWVVALRPCSKVGVALRPCRGGKHTNLAGRRLCSLLGHHLNRLKRGRCDVPGHYRHQNDAAARSNNRDAGSRASFVLLLLGYRWS